MRNPLSRRATRIIGPLILASAPAVFMVVGLDLAGSVFAPGSAWGEPPALIAFVTCLPGP
jgi:hypothetical protein